LKKEETAMTISAALVKELRERTGLGMMDCKKALVETNGDIEVAIENLRKSGQAKAAKKAGRIAAEGTIRVYVSADGKKAGIIEVNCETDFVGRGEILQGYADQVLATAVKSAENALDKLAALTLEGESVTVEEKRLSMVQEIGENIQIRRVEFIEAPEGVVGQYIHGGKIGVLVALKGGSAELAKDVAMHVAGHAPAPIVVNPNEVSEELVAKEKEIFIAQAKDSGKPDEIIQKMVAGRIQKFLAEVSLVEQGFVKDPDTKVGALVKKANATVVRFVRYEVGEGIEKVVVDFAEEVRAQVKGH
jgi:elongation factor Ts